MHFTSTFTVESACSWLTLILMLTAHVPLVDAGYDVTVASYGPLTAGVVGRGGESGFQTEHPRLPRSLYVRTALARPGPGFVRSLWDLRLRRWLRGLLERVRYDLVHAQHLPGAWASMN